MITKAKDSNLSPIKSFIKSTVGYQNFKNNLIIKQSKGKKYYYLQVKNPFYNRQVYIGTYTQNEEILTEYYLQLRLKERIDIIRLILETNYEEKYNKTTLLSNELMTLIEVLRYFHYFKRKDLSDTALENYEESIYTKYVHGTTEVEGNTYSLRETDLTLNQKQTVSGKSLKEFYEIINFDKLKNELRNRKFEVSIDFILWIHSIILAHIEDEAAGQIRNIMVGISGTDLSPTPPVLIESELEQLCKYYEENSEIFYIEKIITFHQKFEEIHPFIDGNGRVGRELMRLQLLDKNLPMIIINNKSREYYLKALDVGNTNDLKPHVDFFLSELFSLFKLEINEISNLIDKSNISINNISHDSKTKKLYKKNQSELIKLLDAIFEKFLNNLENLETNHSFLEKLNLTLKQYLF
jgi:Fic family protein